MDLVLYIGSKCGQGGRGSKIPKILWTSYEYRPYDRIYIPAALLQLVLLPVDDHRSDLLVHEDKDGCQHCWHDGRDRGPPWVRLQLLGRHSTMP